MLASAKRFLVFGFMGLTCLIAGGCRPEPTINQSANAGPSVAAPAGAAPAPSAAKPAGKFKGIGNRGGPD